MDRTNRIWERNIIDIADQNNEIRTENGIRKSFYGRHGIKVDY